MKANYFIVILLTIIQIEVASAQVGIGTTTPGARLDVTKPGGDTPTVNFRGSVNISHFNFGTAEDTYIRGGKSSSNVILADLGSGRVGLGTSTPGFPLNFPNALGDKIALWGNSGNHYGFGIQSALLQIHTDGAGADIAFGYGTSGTFNETMRMTGSGLLRFPALVGKKIILYPGGIGDANLGVFGNELRISSDYAGADITFGYDNRTSGFTEKFRMKANGSLSVSGNSGNSGQVLQSKGTGDGVGWATLGSLIQSYSNTPGFLLNFEGATSSTNQLVVFTALTTTVTVTTKSRLIISAAFRGTNGGCLGCGDRRDLIDIRIDGVEMGSGIYASVVDLIVANGSTGSTTISNFMYDVNPGTHTIEFIAQGSADINLYSKYSTVLVMPID